MSLRPYLPGDSVPRVCPQQRSQSTLSAWHSSERGSIAHRPSTSHSRSPLQLWLAFGTHHPNFSRLSKKPVSWKGNCSYHLSWAEFTWRFQGLFSRSLTRSSRWVWGPSWNFPYSELVSQPTERGKRERESSLPLLMTWFHMETLLRTQGSKFPEGRPAHWARDASWRSPSCFHVYLDMSYKAIKYHKKG